MQYVNPFRILGWSDSEQLEPSEIDRAIQKTLAEFDLVDGFSIERDGIVLDKAAAKLFLQELRDPVRYRGHLLVNQFPELCDFLTHGSLDYFKLSRSQLAMKMCRMSVGIVRARLSQDGELKNEPTHPTDVSGQVSFLAEFVSPYFATALSRVLVTNYSSGRMNVVLEICGQRFLLVESDGDVAFGALYRLMETECVGPLRACMETMSKGERSVNVESRLQYKKLLEQIQPQLLNGLPSYYQELRNEVGACINDMAVCLHRNDRRDVLAVTGWRQAAKINLSGESARVVRENINNCCVTSETNDQREIPSWWYIFLVIKILFLARACQGL